MPIHTGDILRILSNDMYIYVIYILCYLIWEQRTEVRAILYMLRKRKVVS